MGLGLLFGLVALVVALIVLGLAIGAALDPASSAYANLSSAVWTTFGPHFVVAALVAVLLALLCRVWGPRLFGSISAFASVAAVLATGYIVVRIMMAVFAAGGSANPLSGLLLGPMTEPPPDRTETMATVDGKPLQATIYLPTQAAARAPVFAYIHGGGFMIGNPTETAADLRWFADRGWLVVSIDYRLFTTGNPTWDKAPADVACGLAWVFANAARFGGDPQRIVLAGDSAGGNLAVNLGFGAALAQVQSSCGPVPVPRAIVVQYPAVDPVAIYERGYPVPGFEPKMLMTGYIGGTPAEFPERIRAISSDTYLSPQAPPTLVIEPEKDGLVVSDSVYAFVERAKAAGADITLARIPFANHIYNQIAANAIGNQARRTITLEYLQARGWGRDDGVHPSRHARACTSG